MIQSRGFPTVMHKRDHWCCIILAPLSAITIPNTQYYTHRTKTNQDRYLGATQQYTEVSTLLWLQGLAQCRKIMYMYATKLAMQLYT